MNIVSKITSTVKSFLTQSRYSPFAWAWSTPDEWTKRDLIKQYTRYVYTVISAISENAAKVEFEIEKVDEKGEIKKILKHPFLDLMRKPNPDFSKFQYLELHFTYMKLVGESFWYVVRGKRTKEPKELYLLRPDFMEVVIDEEDPRGLVAGYVMHKPDGTEIPFEKDEIQHFKMPNPAYPYRGLGTVQAAKVYIETEHYTSHWKRNSIYNSGRPSGIVTMKGKMNKDQFNKLIRQFNDQYNGVDNVGKTLFLKDTEKIDYQKLSMDIGEVAMKEMRDMSLDDIMVMFRISKTILGISEDVNLANAREAKAVFIENVIIPEIDRMVDQLDAFFIDTFGPDVNLSYKDPRLVNDKDKLEEHKQGAHTWLTINEIRQERGLEPVEGGDVLYVPINLIPIDDENNNNSGSNSNKSKKLNKDSTKSAKAIKLLKKKDSDDLPKADPKVVERAENFRQRLYKIQSQFEKRYEKVMREEFDTQKKEILDRNQKGIVSKELEEWLFDVTRSNNRIVGSLTPLALELIRQQADLALELASDDDTEFILSQAIRDYVNYRLSKMARGTNDLTIEKLKETLSEGILNGESVDKLIDRIQSVYAQANDVRAELIARTESIAASNAATEEAYRQSPVVKYKEWFANPGACEFCMALAGKVVGVEVDFYKMGQEVEGESGGVLPITYDDVGHPPLHPDCRCTIIPVRG